MSKRKHQIEAYFRHGQQLLAAGRLAEAEQLYRQLLAAAPDHADSLDMMGVVALQAGQPGAALDWFDRAIALHPSAPALHPSAPALYPSASVVRSAAPSVALYYVHQAHALLALGRPGDALTACRRALQVRRNCAEASFAMGHALNDLGRPQEAVVAYQTAQRQNARLPDLDNSLALALLEANRLEEAARTLDAVVRRAPGDTQARNNLAGVLRELGRLDAAEAMYRAAIRQAPNDASLHENLAIVLLLAGRLAEGWAESEWRWRGRPALAMGFTQPRWEGEELNGRTLLVHAEQGIGSNIQFCRYVTLIPLDGQPRANILPLPLREGGGGRGPAANSPSPTSTATLPPTPRPQGEGENPPGGRSSAGRIILAVQRSLVRLFESLRPGVEVIALGDPLPPIDLRCPMLSLPRLLGTNRVEDIPAAIPYLRADPVAVARCRRRTEALPGLRVGLVWHGNPEDVRMDRRRSMPLAHMAPLADVPAVSLVSLQVGDAARQLSGSPLAGTVHDWTVEFSDFADTAALIEALDLVIGVDTAVVHLAGALGKPVWLLNRFDTCWRWLLGRDDSPWYPTLRQFRQPSAGDWQGVMERVRAALTAEAADLQSNARKTNTDCTD
jgi:tetratricopeptide (TPR) repeat protein